MKQRYWAIVSKRSGRIKKDGEWSMIFTTIESAEAMLHFEKGKNYYEIKEITIKTKR